MNTNRPLAWSLTLMLLGFALLALSVPTAHADPGIVRVTTTGTTTWPCGDLSDWSNACALQTALTNSVSPSELWVAAGTYTPTTTEADPRLATFQLRNGIVLYGGFAMTETVRSKRNYAANVTLLSGDLNGNDSGNVRYNEPTRSENAYHVVNGSGTISTAILDGFTVTSGNASSGSPPNYGGGGMYNNSGSPTLANITFTSNTASYGGGMYNWTSSPTLTNVTFISNTARDGGGMYNWTSSPTLTNVTFISNTAYEIGGGMRNTYSSATLTNVTFRDNSAAGFHGSGGGMYNDYQCNLTLTNVTFISNTAEEIGGGMYHGDLSFVTLTNVTFISNTATYYGGGMVNDYSHATLSNVTFISNTARDGGGISNVTSARLTLTNVIFISNTASSEGGGMHNSGYSIQTVRNTILWANTAPSSPQIYNGGTGTASVYDSIVQGGCPAGSTCTTIIDADPLLGALGDWGGSTQTFRLRAGSPAIDEGDATTCAPTDQRGKPRVGICDIGTFEWQGYALSKTSGDHQSTAVSAAFASPLDVALYEIDAARALADVTITFAAPSSGPSAAWSGSRVVTATTNASGAATVGAPTANGLVGSYEINVSAAVEPPTATASATFMLTNAKADTTTVITSSENPVVASHPFTLTVAVSPVPAIGIVPTGSVSLYETVGGSAAVHGTRRTLAAQPLVDGVATFPMAGLTPGAHTFLALYDGDATCNASTSAVYTQTADWLRYYWPFISRQGP